MYGKNIWHNVKLMEKKVILQEMQEIFPPVQPTPHDSVEMIMYKAGQRYVVEWLLQRMEQ